MQVPSWLNTPLFHAAGWTILHSVWQSLLLLAVLKIFLAIVSDRRSGTRYAVSLGVLFAAVLWSLITFIREYQSAVGNPAIAVALPFDAATGSPNIAADHLSAGQGYTLVLWTNMLSRLCPYICIIWGIGSLFYTMRLLQGGLQLRKLRTLSSENFPETFSALERLRGRLGIPQKVRLIITDRVGEALTFGSFKPMIVLPLHYISQVPASQIDLILAHELAHIRRRDYAVNLLQAMAEVLFFFNPFFRHLSGLARNEREYCCDDVAAAVCGDPQELALALASIKVLASHPGLSLSASPRKETVYLRVKRLVEPSLKPALSIRSATWGLILGAGVLLLISRCRPTMAEYNELPQVTDQIEQVLTDNQAGNKEQVFYYKRAGQAHDIFLVSTIEEKRLYAYLDGKRLPVGALAQVEQVLQTKRTIPPPPPPPKIANISEKLYVSGKKPGQQQLARDSIASAVKIAIEGYEHQVKFIPIDVKLHEVLTRIINNQVYTPEDRQTVNELIRQRWGI
jgi:bla regulator protein BlaR1